MAAADSSTIGLDVKRILWTNLSLLNITPKTFKSKHDVEFNRDSFDIPNPSLACKMLYELSLLLNENLALKYLQFDFKPTMNKQVENDFKKIFFQFLQKQSTQQPHLNLQEISTNQLVNLHGKNFYYFLAMLTGAILQSMMLEADPSITLPEFVFEDGHNHKMFVESYAESCQKFCLLKSKHIMKLAEKQQNMEQSFECVKSDLVDGRDKLLQQLGDLRVKCDEICNNDDLNPEELKNSTEQLHVEAKSLLDNFQQLLQKFTLNQPYIDNSGGGGTLYDACLNSSVLQNNVANYSMQMNDFNKTLNLNMSHTNVLLNNNNDRTNSVDLTLLLDKMEMILEPIKAEIDLFHNEYTNDNIQFNLDKWIEFKERHSNFLQMLESLR